MESYQKYLNPQTLAKIHGLHLRAKHIVEGYVAGLHRSPFRGFSIEFAEHRVYSPGDDLRYLDWKVLARTDKHYLKQFEDETNLICYIVLDTSESMRYRGPDAALSKFDYAACLTVALAWMTLAQQDSVSLVTFDSEIRSLIGPASGGTQLQNIVQAIEHSSAGTRTTAGPIFHQLSERLTKRGVVIIISDLFDDVHSISTGLRHLRYRKHDVIVCQLLDRAEIDFPFRGSTRFEGMEQMPDVVTDPESLRSAYLEEFHRFHDELKLACQNNRSDFVQACSDEGVDDLIDRLVRRKHW